MDPKGAVERKGRRGQGGGGQGGGGGRQKLIPLLAKGKVLLAVFDGCSCENGGDPLGVGSLEDSLPFRFEL
jgi:hypothetical protein